MQYGMSQRILPLCLTLKCLCSESCPPVGGRKEEIDALACLRLTFLGDIYKINGLFTLFPHFSPISNP